MSTQPDEILSVKSSRGNQVGDIVEGRTCRTLNVTRKIIIRDIEPSIRMSLEMTQFSIGSAVFEQIRGSPMGSPLSLALCLMVVRNRVPNIRIVLDVPGSFFPISTLCGQSSMLGGHQLALNPASRTSSMRISMANLLFWRLKPTRNSWASSWSSNLHVRSFW